MSGIFGGGGDGGAASAMEEQRKQTEAERKRLQEEQRSAAEHMAGRRTARLRGGSRLLLSEARLSPETGITDTLGQSKTTA